jgi:thymidine kinase
MTGRLEVIVGPMYSGKSEELIRRIVRHEIAGRKSIIIKPSIDTRYSEKDVVSHAGRSHEGHPCRDPFLIRSISRGYDVIGIDEAQFYGEGIVTAVEQVMKEKPVIIAGLDMDYQKSPFGYMPHLMAIATEIIKLKSVCHVCGADAMYTYRLVGTGPTVQIGGQEAYEARCPGCYDLIKGE